MHQSTLRIKTQAKSFTEITNKISEFVAQSKIRTGLCNVFIQHTSASLLITENADPDVRLDLESYLSDLVPESRKYIHDAEGKDDMPAHIRTALTETSINIPIVGGRLGLGTWQGVYLWEHRDWSHDRQVIVTISGK